MIVGTPQKYKHHRFVDTYLLPDWLLDLPCAGFSRKDALMRPSLNEPIATASKQPWRSKLMLQVKLVTPICYVSKFQGTFINEIS